MRRVRRWLIRLTTSMTRRHDDTRLREEIDDYVAFETEANLRRGLPSAEARRRALLTFGSMETFEENCRDQQGVPPLEHLLQDVRIALRRMWTTPGFTAAAIATLALGLGLTSAVTSLAYALFLRPLPVDDAARVVFLEQTRVDRPGGWGYSYPDYLYLREHARSFSELAAHNSTMPPVIVATPRGPVGVSGAVVTANYFSLLRLTPRAGRFFSVVEDRVPGRDAVAILSYDFWRTRFAEDPHLVGTTVRINGTPFTVIGIAPEHASKRFQAFLRQVRRALRRPGGPNRSRRRGFPGTHPIRRTPIRWARRSSVLGTSRRWASASSRAANSMTATRWTVRASPS